MKDIVKIVHLPSVVQSEFNEATRTLFMCKEHKNNNFIQQICFHVTVVPFWRVSTGPKQSTLFCVIRTTWIRCFYSNQSANKHRKCICVVWLTQKSVRCFGPTNTRIKLLFLFSLHRKSVLVASVNSDWTTDGRWSILTMSFILWWTWIYLTLSFTWQSMGQSQVSQFSSKLSQIVFRRRMKILQVWNDMGVSF